MLLTLHTQSIIIYAVDISSVFMLCTCLDMLWCVYDGLKFGMITVMALTQAAKDTTSKLYYL